MARAAALVIAFLALGGIAHSGTIFIGTPTVDTGTCYGCGDGGAPLPLTPSVTITDGSLLIDAQQYSEFQPVETVDVTIPITITGDPTNVMLSLAASFSASGNDCGDSGCAWNPQMWQLAGTLQSQATLSGLDLMANASGGAPGTCGVDGIAQLCSATINLSGSDSGEIQLDPGTYDLTVSLEGEESSTSGGFLDLGAQLTLVDPPGTDPVPEPPLVWTLAAAGLIPLLRRRRPNS